MFSLTLISLLLLSLSSFISTAPTHHLTIGVQGNTPTLMVTSSEIGITTETEGVNKKSSEKEILRPQKELKLADTKKSIKTKIIKNHSLYNKKDKLQNIAKSSEKPQTPLVETLEEVKVTAKATSFKRQGEYKDPKSTQKLQTVEDSFSEATEDTSKEDKYVAKDSRQFPIDKTLEEEKDSYQKLKSSKQQNVYEKPKDKLIKSEEKPQLTLDLARGEDENKNLESDTFKDKAQHQLTPQKTIEAEKPSLMDDKTLKIPKQTNEYEIPEDKLFETGEKLHSTLGIYNGKEEYESRKPDTSKPQNKQPLVEAVNDEKASLNNEMMKESVKQDQTAEEYQLAVDLTKGEDEYENLEPDNFEPKAQQKLPAVKTRENEKASLKKKVYEKSVDKLLESGDKSQIAFDSPIREEDYENLEPDVSESEVKHQLPLVKATEEGKVLTDEFVKPGKSSKLVLDLSKREEEHGKLEPGLSEFNANEQFPIDLVTPGSKSTSKDVKKQKAHENIEVNKQESSENIKKYFKPQPTATAKNPKKDKELIPPPPYRKGKSEDISKFSLDSTTRKYTFAEEEIGKQPQSFAKSKHQLPSAVTKTNLKEINTLKSLKKQRDDKVSEASAKQQQEDIDSMTAKSDSSSNSRDNPSLYLDTSKEEEKSRDNPLLDLNTSKEEERENQDHYLVESKTKHQLPNVKVTEESKTILKENVKTSEPVEKQREEEDMEVVTQESTLNAKDFQHLPTISAKRHQEDIDLIIPKSYKTRKSLDKRHLYHDGTLSETNYSSQEEEMENPATNLAKTKTSFLNSPKEYENFQPYQQESFFRVKEDLQTQTTMSDKQLNKVEEFITTQPSKTVDISIVAFTKPLEEYDNIKTTLELSFQNSKDIKHKPSRTSIPKNMENVKTTLELSTQNSKDIKNIPILTSTTTLKNIKNVKTTKKQNKQSLKENKEMSTANTPTKPIKEVTNEYYNLENSTPLPTKITNMSFISTSLSPKESIKQIQDISIITSTLTPKENEEISTIVATLITPKNEEVLETTMNLPADLEPQKIEDISSTVKYENDDTLETNINSKDLKSLTTTDMLKATNDKVTLLSKKIIDKDEEVEKLKEGLQKEITTIKTENDNDRIYTDNPTIIRNENLLLTTAQMTTTTTAESTTTSALNNAAEQQPATTIYPLLTMPLTATTSENVDDNDDNNKKQEAIENSQTVEFLENHNKNEHRTDNENVAKATLNVAANVKAKSDDTKSSHGDNNNSVKFKQREGYVTTPTKPSSSLSSPVFLQTYIPHETISVENPLTTMTTEFLEEFKTDGLENESTVIETEKAITTTLSTPFSTNEQQKTTVSTRPSFEITPKFRETTTTEKVLKLLDLEKHVLATYDELKERSLLPQQHDNGHDGLKNIKKKQLIDKHYVENFLNNKQDDNHQSEHRQQEELTHAKSSTTSSSILTPVTSKPLLVPIKHGFLGPILMEEKTFHVIHHAGYNDNVMATKTPHLSTLETQLRNGHFVELKAKTEMEPLSKTTTTTSTTGRNNDIRNLADFTTVANKNILATSLQSNEYDSLKAAVGLKQNLNREEEMYPTRNEKSFINSLESNNQKIFQKSAALLVNTVKSASEANRYKSNPADHSSNFNQKPNDFKTSATLLSDTVEFPTDFPTKETSNGEVQTKQQQLRGISSSQLRENLQHDFQNSAKSTKASLENLNSEQVSSDELADESPTRNVSESSPNDKKRQYKSAKASLENLNSEQASKDELLEESLTRNMSESSPNESQTLTNLSTYTATTTRETSYTITENPISKENSKASLEVDSTAKPFQYEESLTKSKHSTLTDSTQLNKDEQTDSPKPASVLSTTVFQIVDSMATKTPIQQANTMFTSPEKEQIKDSLDNEKEKSESKISDIQIEVYDSTIDSIVASTNFKDSNNKPLYLEDLEDQEEEEANIGKTTKPPVAPLQQERFTQYVIDRTETSTQEPINYSTIQVGSGKPEPAAIEIHINVSESFGNESEDLEFSYPQTEYNNNNDRLSNGGQAGEEDSYDDSKINDNVKLQIPSNTGFNNSGKDARSDEILVVEIIDSDNSTEKIKTKNSKSADDLFISDNTPPPPPPPPPYQANFDRDSDTIFYISNTEVKVGESLPTAKNAYEERKLKLENQFFPANYMASTHPNLNTNEESPHHLYEEDIILSSNRNQADSLKIYRNRNEPSPPLDVTYVGESIIEVEQSPEITVTTTYAPDQHFMFGTQQADVIIQPAILPEISIGVPVIGELPPQIELKEIDFMPNEAQMHRSGIYNYENDNSNSINNIFNSNNNIDIEDNAINAGSNSNSHDVDIINSNNNNNQRLDESSIQYGGDLIDESADGGFDGVEGSYPFGNPASAAAAAAAASVGMTKIRKQQNHVADYAHLYVNYGVNNMRKDELSADVKDSGELLAVGGGGGIGANSNEQNTTSFKEFLNKVSMNNSSSLSSYINGNLNQTERMSNATAFSVMEDANDLEDKNTEDIVNLISLAIGLFIVILPVVVTCSMFWALRYLYKKYHSNVTDSSGYSDQTDTKGQITEDGLEKGELIQEPPRSPSPTNSDIDAIQAFPITSNKPSTTDSTVKFSTENSDHLDPGSSKSYTFTSPASKTRENLQLSLDLHTYPKVIHTVHDEIEIEEVYEVEEGPNGSITKMTLENNLLIVETEESNDISRVARETKMDYHKEGVFVVEVSRGIDSKTVPDSPITEGSEKMLSMFDTKHNNGVLGYKMSNEKNCLSNEKVQIHSPPPENSTDEGPRSLHQIEEVEEPMTSPHFNADEEDECVVGLAYKSNTGLSQSDLSTTSSNDSNKGYSYGNQALYVVDQTGYSTMSPTGNIVLKCDTKDIKDEDHNPENDHYLEHSPDKKEDKSDKEIKEDKRGKANDAGTKGEQDKSPQQKENYEEKQNEELRRDDNAKVIKRKEELDDLNSIREYENNEILKENYENSKINCSEENQIPISPISKTSIIVEVSSICDVNSAQPFTSISAETSLQMESLSIDESLIIIEPSMPVELSIADESVLEEETLIPDESLLPEEALSFDDTSVPVDVQLPVLSIHVDESSLTNKFVVPDETINFVETLTVKLIESSFPNDNPLPVEHELPAEEHVDNREHILAVPDKFSDDEKENSTITDNGVVNENGDVIENGILIKNGAITENGVITENVNLENSLDHTVFENGIIETEKELPQIIGTPEILINGNQHFVKEHKSKAVTDILNEANDLNQKLLNDIENSTQIDIKHLTNGLNGLPDLVNELKSSSTLQNGVNDIESLNNFTTDMENGYDSIMSLPDPPPTTDEQLNNDLSDQQLDSLPPPPPPETFNLKDLPPPLTNGDTDSLPSEESNNFYNTLPPPPPTTLEVSTTTTTNNGKMHASPLTPPASPPAHFTNNLHAGLCPQPIAVDVNGS